MTTIILYQPQIPQNTGNVVRTCACTGANLILVTPLGFSTSDRWLKRSGLDYWENVDVTQIDSLENYLDQTSRPFYFFSSKGAISYETVPFPKNPILIFGSETEGLPSHFSEKYPDRFLRLPMLEGARCLNLATSVGIALYGSIYLQQKFY